MAKDGTPGSRPQGPWFSDERIWFGAYLLAITVVVAVTLFFIGQAAIAPSPSSIPIDNEMSISEQRARLEVSLIRDQLQENKNYNDRLLQIVLWSLSTVVGVAAAVLGANLFVSYRATQRERESLQDTKESLNALEESYRDSRSRLAGFIVETAIKSAEREIPSGNYQEAIEILHKVCTDGDVNSAGSEIARSWMTAVQAVLSSISDDLKSERQLAVEPEIVERLRKPVTQVGTDFWGIRWQAVLIQIDTITKFEPEEDAPRNPHTGESPGANL